MNKKLHLGFVFALVLLLVAGAVYAQDDPGGSIRGTVYDDQNADGKCVGTGEPALSGVTVKFVTADAKNVIYLESGDDGTYGLVAAGLGTWTVTAEPSSGRVVTSNNPISVFLSAEERLVLNVDFCIAGAGTTPPTSTPPATVLPESGGTVAPILLAALAAGGSLVAVGAGLEIRRRRTS